MEKMILFFITSMFMFAANAQLKMGNHSQTNFLTPLFHIHKSFTNNKNPNGILSEVIGTPYENEKLELGEIVHTNSKQKIQKLFLRYNAFNDQIEVSKTLEASELHGLLKSDHIYARINNKEYHYKRYKDLNNQTKKGYLIKLRSNTKISLYKLLVKKYTKAKAANTSYHKNTPAKFTDQHTYYLEIGEKLFLVSSSKKKTISIFPNNQKEVKDFIGKEKLSLKKEKDLVKLVNFYSTL
ncbi:hypothetical protein ATO12_11595 [Aquimarina atlantica]|uniref:Uncharacterized protein n=1 Tax=Aquimarina atlantica TaxID=1317122 RepID=A0A023BWI6_9FLAO|nr:hypothetical protein [Aquimarina atlantica]EZH74406.1 hypothetical protein ATO12_11595 [Aquimarina atlantica]